MQTNIARTLALIFVVPATYYFVYWLPFSMIDTGSFWWIPQIVSLACAAAVGWFVWRALGAADATATTSALSGAVVLGGIGFTAGFFGPMLFAPSANQGPLLGFLVAPIGFLVGAIAGLIYWRVRVYHESGVGA